MRNRKRVIAKAVELDLKASDGLTDRQVEDEEFEDWLSRKITEVNFQYVWTEQATMLDREELAQTRANLFEGYTLHGYPLSGDEIKQDIEDLGILPTTKELETLREAAEGPRPDLRDAAREIIDLYSPHRESRNTQGAFSHR